MSDNCTNCGQLENGSVVTVTETQDAFCDPCGEGSVCIDKFDAGCVFYHIEDTPASKLENLGLPNKTSLEAILEKIDDLLGTQFNIPLVVTDSETIDLVSSGSAGHNLTADLKVSPNAGNIIQVLSNGVFVPNLSDGKVKVNSTDVADYLINQVIGGTDSIVSNSVVLDSGMVKVQPSIDISCLLDEIQANYFSKLCEIVALCVSSVPTVIPTCGSASVSGSFVAGVPSTGSVTLPVTVTGTGTIMASVTISGSGFAGSTSVAINSSTSSLVIPFSFDGSYPSGNRTVTVVLSGVSSGYVSCNVTMSVSCGACNPTSSIQITNIGSTTATASWLTPSPAPASGYQVNVKELSGDALVFTGTTLTNNIALTGLPSADELYVEVTSLCSSGCTSTVATSSPFTTESPSFSYNFFVQNTDVVGAEVADVTPAVYLVQSGALPLASGENVSCIHGGFSSALSVTVTGTPGTARLILYKNGVQQQCQDVGAAGVYAFSALTYSYLDTCNIVLELGACT